MSECGALCSRVNGRYVALTHDLNHIKFCGLPATQCVVTVTLYVKCVEVLATGIIADGVI